VRQGITIAHGVFVDGLCDTDDFDRIDGGEVEYPLDVGQEIVKPAEAVPILTSGRRRAIAELGGHRPVQEIGTRRARLVGDGIEHQLGLHPTGNEHRAPRQKGPVRNDAAPDQDAVPGGRSLVRIEETAHR
jgi:hypothetical protein